MDSLSSIEKDSVVTTTRDSLKYCILVSKIRNQMHTNFKKRKVPQVVIGNFAQKFCLMFCTIFVPLNMAKILGKHVQSSSYLVLELFNENSRSHGKFTERLILRTPIFGW